jgi:hypothetical protein
VRAGRLALALLAALGIAAAISARAAGQEVSRVIVGLYNGKDERTLRRTRLHRLAEMPLNHLGLVLMPHDVSDGLPSEEAMRGARGIITWFTDATFSDPQAYLAWLERQLLDGKRLVVLDHLGVDPAWGGGIALRKQFERVGGLLGLRWEGEWVGLTYATRVVAKDSDMVEFERSLPTVLRPYRRVSVISPDVRSYLSVRREGRSETDHLVLTGPRGGYVAADYSIYEVPGATDAWFWYLNPFRFFREAFAADEVPKPDTTTMSGRRMFYSHIDGDAWHNISSAEGYIGKGKKSAEVIYEQILLKYPDLPVTVAPVTADLDDDWYGDEEARELAQRMFALPWVEAGSHTHSHPFAWGFFRNPDPRNEAPYLRFYPPRPGKTQRDSVWDPEKVLGGLPVKSGSEANEVEGAYQRPRTYAVRPFNIELEIAGSIKLLNALMPAGKRVEIIQWSGDTSPFERVLQLTAAAGVRNINGGEPRMDGPFSSYARVSPLGLRVGKLWQVYSSTSNENIYTDNWRGRFFGFRNLAETLANLETPIRIRPINVYYHFYSAEREEGLSSIRFNLDYARGQEIAPITTSRFAAMVDGFYAARIVKLGERQWRIENRGALETVRFDNATMLSVDFERSLGVLGQRHSQGSLYVALDRAVAAPVVAIKDYATPERDPDAARPYLVHARWRVEGVELAGEGWRFRAAGYGPGEFVWKVPTAGRYRVTAVAPTDKRYTAEIEASAERLLRFTAAVPGEEGSAIEIERLSGSQ